MPKSKNHPIQFPRALLVLSMLHCSVSLFAQAIAPDAATLAKYDTNKNGRLDPNEVEAMNAAEAKAAKIPITHAATPSASESETVQLSPFEVKEANNGYFATNTMSGTRLSSKLEDIAASISVVTKQQMADFAMLDINDIFAYEAGTEGTGNYTAYEIDRSGQVSDQIMDNPQGANRVRGMTAANISLSGFATSGRTPVDPINIDAVEISRGPNSNIFGIGEGSGTVNLVAASANLNRAFTSAQLRFDDLGGWRTSLDLNRPVIRNKLSLRLSGVYQHDAFMRKPSGYDTRRFNAMLRAQPFRLTTVRASFQSVRSAGTRANAIPPKDGVSYWIRNGSPTWDPTTSTVTVRGVSTVMGATNPVGLVPHDVVDPILYVDRNGIGLWEIGRMPAAGVTNGPNNTGGVNRMVTTVPDPVQTGRPLFSTLPAVSSRDIYDYRNVNLSAPNFSSDRVDISTVEVEQTLLESEKNKIAFQFAWQREDADRKSRNIVGSTSPGGGASYNLFIDPNSRLLDGRVNPYYLRPYIGVAEPVNYETPYVRDSYRGQLAYIFDLTKASTKWIQWLGRHQFLGYYEERKTKNYAYRFRDAMISDNPIYAPAGTPKGNQSTTGSFGPSPIATRGYYHYYVGDNQGYNVDNGPAKIAAGNYP